MSSNEKEYLFDDAIDLGGIFSSIWYCKYVLLLFLALSVPFSLYVTTLLPPQFKAQTVFEKPNSGNSQSSLMNANQRAPYGILLNGLGQGEPGDSFFSVIRSDSFLKTVFIKNPSLDNENFKKICPVPTEYEAQFSLKSLLIMMGLSENKTPSKMQVESLLVDCVNAMLEIEYDTHNSIKTSAFKLSITSNNPTFSANLANQIVEKYFKWHDEKTDLNFQNIKKYLSSVISDAQSEYTAATKLMHSFIMKHTVLIKLAPSANYVHTNDASNFGGSSNSPFRSELNKEIAYLSQLEKSLSQLKQAKLKLSELKKADFDKIKNFISSTQLKAVFSRAFIASLGNIDNSNGSTFPDDQNTKILVSRELQSLEKQIGVVASILNQKELQTRKLIDIESTFQELAMDVQKKKLIFEGLKDQLKEKILSTGLENVGQPILLTRAVTPFIRVSPNKKIIVVLGALLSVFGGIAFALIRQAYSKRIFSLSQLRGVSKFLSCHKIKLKQLNLIIDRPDKTVLNQSVFSKLKGKGKLGCVIDLSQKTLNNALAATFSTAIAKLLAFDNTKIVCLNSSVSKKPFSTEPLKNFISSDDNLDGRYALNDTIAMINDQNAVIESGDVKKIRNKYSEYDKILCGFGGEVGDLTIFKFIEQCDFYILIGRSSQFDEYDCRKFSNNVWEKENKCVGFFLID